MSLNATNVTGVLAALCFSLRASGQPVPVSEVGVLPGDAIVAPATASQQEHSIARGGEQYLMVWSDYRARSAGSQSIQGDGDIFGIRLDINGDPIDAAPFLVAGGMGLQQRPLVAWNGQAWLVVYSSQDPVGGYFAYRIRAVRVSAEASVLDADPIAFPPTQFEPDDIGLQVAGQNGEWLVTRCIYHDDGYGTYLAGQRIDGNGVLLDAAPIMLNDWVYGQTRALTANGEYLVVGPDWNQSAALKARRIGPDLQPIGASFNVPSLNIASSGSEYYVTWIADFTNLVGSRMTATGALLNPAGTLIVEGYSQYHQSVLTHDGSQWWLEWGAADELHTVRISSAGVVLDPNGGVLLPIEIGGNINNAYSCSLSPKAGGGALLAWYDMRAALGSDANVFVLPIDANNVAGTERCVSTSTPNQRDADFAAGPDDTTAVVFVSEHANDDRVLVHLLGPTGYASTPEPIEVYRGATVGKAGIAFNGTAFLVTFDVGASGLTPTQIKARRMNPDGSFVDEEAFDVMPGFNPDVEALGDNFLVAGSRPGPTPQWLDLWANRIDGWSAARLDGANGVMLHLGFVSGVPRVRTDGSQWLVASHAMWSHDASQGDALLVKVPAFGAPGAPQNPTPISGGSGDLDIAFSGNKYLLVWRMHSLANANNYIAGRIMNADGTFPSSYFTIAEAPGRQLRPTVTWDGSTFIVAWDDQRAQQSFFDARTHIHAARVTDTGTVLDPGSFVVHTSAQADAAVTLVSRGDGLTLAAASRFMTTAAHASYRIALAAIGVVPADIDGDGDVDLSDYGRLFDCLSPPGSPVLPDCAAADLDGDTDADVRDFMILQMAFTAP